MSHGFDEHWQVSSNGGFTSNPNIWGEFSGETCSWKSGLYS